MDKLLGALRELIDRIASREPALTSDHTQHTAEHRASDDRILRFSACTPYTGRLMPVGIALLRAVNLGPHNRIKMEALRGICETLGCKHVQTLIQSGNLVFSTRERSLHKLAARIEEVIESQLGFRPAVITRTTADLRQVVAGNPFAGRSDIHPSKLLVTFLSAEPSEESRQKVLAMNTAPEELHLRGSEVYMYFPNGLGRPKTSAASIEKALKVPGTGRNWNVVTKLLALAEGLEKAG